MRWRIVSEDCMAEDIGASASILINRHIPLTYDGM